MMYMYVCLKRQKRVDNMERACGSSKRERRVKMPEDLFQSSPEKSDLEVVNCSLKSSLSAGDLPRKCLAV